MSNRSTMVLVIEKVLVFRNEFCVISVVIGNELQFYIILR